MNQPIELTPRETRMLRELGQSGYVKKAADRLGMQPGSLYDALDNMRNKTHMTTVQMIYWQAKRGAI